jgi:DNA-binding beta-propeller fold protein YncE
VVHPNGKRIYVTSLGTNQIASVGVDDLDVKLIDVPAEGGAAHSLVQAAISPDGKWLAFTGELTGKLFIYDLTDPVQPKFVRDLSVGKGSFELAFTGGGRWLYVTARQANQVAVVDTKNWTVASNITGPTIVLPHGITMSSDGKYVYVGSEYKSEHADSSHQQHQGMSMGGGSGPGTLTIICAANQKVITGIPVGKQAAGLGTMHPRGALPAPSACR